MEQLTPEQREQGLAMQATDHESWLLHMPAISLDCVLIIAAVLMAVFNFMLGAEVPFQRAMAVVFLCVPSWIFYDHSRDV